MKQLWLKRTIPLALLLVIAAPGWAQQAPDEGQAEEQSEQQQTKVDSKPAAAADSAAQSNDSPFDYESSERISEDSSVSFPIDI